MRKVLLEDVAEFGVNTVFPEIAERGWLTELEIAGPKMDCWGPAGVEG